MRIASAWMAACALAAGCAAPQEVPSDLDLTGAAIVLNATEPVQVPNGSPGKGVAIGVGVAGGASTGVMVAVFGCVGAGLFYPMCLAALLPAATAIGAVSGAMVGGLVSQPSDAMQATTAMLKTELAATPYLHLLAQQVQKQARERFAVELSLVADTPPSNGGPVPASASASARRWWIEVALTQVSPDKAKPDQPFALRVEGRLKLRRSSESDAVYETHAFATSDAALTAAEWAANGAEPVRRGMDQGLRLLADKLLSELMRNGPPARAGDTDGLQARRTL